MISPLRYSGGKSRLYKQIKQYFPKNKNVMIDLFFGGGSVGLNWLLDNEKHYLIINDIDKNLINFWRKVNELNYDEYWVKFKYLVNDIEKTKYFFDYANLNTPLYYLIKNKCSYNGIGTFSSKAFEQNFTKTTFDRINKCQKLLREKCWEIKNEDYELIFEFYNNLEKVMDISNIFYYLDPPYMVPNAKKLYKHGEFNHELFLYKLKENKFNWVLSYNDCLKIRELYKDFNIYEIDAIYSSTNNNGNKSKKIKELIITNFNKD